MLCLMGRMSQELGRVTCQEHTVRVPRSIVGGGGLGRAYLYITINTNINK